MGRRRRTHPARSGAAIEFADRRFAAGRVRQMWSPASGGNARTFYGRSQRLCHIADSTFNPNRGQPMKTVILCGGRGTRLGEHGVNVSKALIEIGGRPVLWHLMKIYAQHGLNDFVLCLGYLGEEIKRYFIEREWLDHDFTLELSAEGAKQMRQ